MTEILIRLEDYIKEALKEKAKADRRSVNQYVIGLILKDIKVTKKGELK